MLKPIHFILEADVVEDDDSMLPIFRVFGRHAREYIDIDSTLTLRVADKLRTEEVLRSFVLSICESRWR